MTQATDARLRPIYLVIYHSPLFAAHWSMWILKVNDNDLGRIIQVHGSIAEGFEHEFKRNHRLSEDSRSSSIKLLDSVPVSSVVDPADEIYYEDVRPIDIFEEIALRVGASLRQGQSAEPRTRVELKNCRTWVSDFVSFLVEQGIFVDSALLELKKCPKN